MKISAKILAAVLGLSLVVACGKKKDDSDQATVRAARDTGATSTGGSNVLPSGQPYNPGPGANVTADDQHASAFNEAVKVLVSATMDPNMVGTVDHKTGVTLQGEVLLDRTTGRMNTSNSKIELIIVDDKKDENGNLYQPISIKVLGTSGTVANGNINLTFSDTYGSITITGTYTASTIDGIVSFQNTQAYNGKSGGTLGRFQMPACNFFNCQ